jgi:hypothetical protein
MARETRAATVYDIVVAVTDNTTSTTTVFTPIVDNGPNDTDPSTSVITVSGAFGTSATGVSLTGLNSTITLGASSTKLTISGTASVVSGNSDDYTITVLASHNAFTTPPGTTASLTQSEAGTFTNTPGAGNQFFQSWYDNTNTLNNTAGVSPGQQSMSIPGLMPTGTQSGHANAPGSAGISPYVMPYALTALVTLDHLKGNGAASNSSVQFSGSSILTASQSIPEPASVVMFLMGMPVPLVVVGFLRHRRRQGTKA